MREALIETIPWGSGPQGLHRALKKAPNPFCLFSGIGGRFSYVGFEPKARLSIFPDRLEFRLRKDLSIFQENPFYWMKALGSIASAASPSPFFASGWVGFFGYETAPFADGSLPRRDLSSNTLLGDWAYYDPVFVFDHQNKKACVASWGINDDFRPELSLAKRRIQEALKNLSTLSLNSPASPALNVQKPFLNDFQSNFSSTTYCSAVKRVLHYIAAGDCYQVNLSQQLLFKNKGGEDPIDLFWYLVSRHPAPFSAYLDLGGTKILSLSPEKFLGLSGNFIETRPIKGTRARSPNRGDDRERAQELSLSLKDQAELLMIVDLERNDLGKICRPGTVQVPRMKTLESYDYVHHLVATVNGELQEGVHPLDAVRALFPGGSITGVPKRRAMQIIQELEPHPRGVYTGVIGFMDFSPQMMLNIAIRTLELTPQGGRLGVGAGIVADSDPAKEYQETLVKARAFI